MNWYIFICSALKGWKPIRRPRLPKGGSDAPLADQESQPVPIAEGGPVQLAQPVEPPPPDSQPLFPDVESGSDLARQAAIEHEAEIEQLEKELETEFDKAMTEGSSTATEPSAKGSAQDRCL